jgi:hypothetical protein
VLAHSLTRHQHLIPKGLRRRGALLEKLFSMTHRLR